MAEFQPQAIGTPQIIPTEQQLTVCRFSPDRAFLYAGGYDGRLYRFRLSDQTHTRFDAHRGWMEGMAVHPDGERLFTADSWGQVHCWRMAAGEMQPLWTIDSACRSWLRALAVSGDGQWLATCGNEPVVRVFSATDGKLAHELRGHEQPVFSVAFAPDSRGVVSGDLHGHVRHWTLADGSLVRQLEAGRLFKPYYQYQQGGVRSMRFDPAGRVLYCAGFEGTNANQAHGVPTVVPFDWESGTALTVLTPTEPFPGPIMDVAMHPAGYVLGSGSSEGGGALWFWKPGEAANVHLVKYQNSFRHMDLSADGRHLALAAFGDMGGQRGGNGRRLNAQGEYPDFGGSLVLYAWPE